MPVPDTSRLFTVRFAARVVSQVEGEAGLSGDMDELRGRMLARQRRSRFRSTTVNSFTLIVTALGLAFVAALLRHQIVPADPTMGHAASSVRAE